MDKLKIGKFIAQKRKEINLTQEQLAEYLGITNKSVSKWECGKCLPDAALMKQLSEILKITVSELLNGECLNEEQQKEYSEKVVIDLIKIIEVLRKQKRIILYIAMGLLLMNISEQLPELLMLDIKNIHSQFLLGMIDGSSTAMLIAGVVFFAAGAALFIRDNRYRI